MRSNCKDMNKKKIFSIVLLSLLLIFLSGCFQVEKQTTTEKQNTVETQNTTEKALNTTEKKQGTTERTQSTIEKKQNTTEKKQNTTEKQNTVKITVVDSIFYTAKTPSDAVVSGEDFITYLTLIEGYECVSCNYYSNYSFEEKDGETLLTLKNVTRPLRVTIQCKKKEIINNISFNLNCTVNYDFNGGIDGEGHTNSTLSYFLTSHQRLNTEIGTDIKKSGYVLTGWNSHPDGNGEHIGLGSRVTVQNEEEITLYAEWQKCIDDRQFLYEKKEDGTIALTGYRGSGDINPFVIPEEINGQEVTEISSSFTTNMPCQKLTAQTLVLPSTIRSVKSNSFFHSSFSELFFSDNIEEIDEQAFPYNIKTFHINAAKEPSFQSVNNSTIYSDIVDRLILNKDKRKLIFFGGCSFMYGLNSHVVEKVFGEDYVVINLGLNGDINAAFQMEIIVNYICEGDVLIHAPEPASSTQLMNVFYVNSIMFIMVEGNYDLLALADFSNNSGVIRAFNDYIAIKNKTALCTYADSRYVDFNIYGDYMEERPYDESTEIERDISYSDDTYYYMPELLMDSGMKRLVKYYDDIREKKGQVFLTYAPVNISAGKNDEIKAKGYEFAEKLEDMLSVYGYRTISSVENYMFLGRYFFDSDWHLNDIGAALRTERLIADLKAEGVLTP
ncbi:MAG: hypothetical protein ACOX16_05925 [Candidatus Izemoplasmatales bacterium]|jgi:hypothetical protein